MTRTEKLLENAEPSPDKDSLHQKLNDIKTRWDAVKAKTSERDEQISELAPVLHDYYTHVDPFSDWLNSLDSKLSTQEPVSCDKKTIERQAEQAKKLGQQLTDHEPEYEKVKELAADVVKSQPDDLYFVEAQVQHLTKRWDSVSLRLNNRTQQTEAVKALVEEYEDIILPVNELFTRAEDGIIVLEVIGCDVDRAKQELSNTEVSVLVMSPNIG